MQDIETVIREMIAPPLLSRGFRRRGRKFWADDDQCVGVLAVQVESSGRRFTIRGAGTYRLWAAFLDAPASLKDPLSYGDWQISATDPHSPFGPTVEKWWFVNQGGSLANELEASIGEQLVPDFQALMSPTSDRLRLLEMYRKARCPDDLLPRLYFWLIHLASHEQADAIRNRLTLIGHAQMVERIEGWSVG